MKHIVLIVDDDQYSLSSPKRLIDKDGYEATISNCGRNAIKKIKQHHYDIVFIDYRLPDMSGLETMKKILEIAPEVVIIFFSAYGTIKTVVKAIKTGAFDYIQKPHKNDESLLSLMRVNEHLKLTREVSHLKPRHQATNPPCNNIIAERTRKRPESWLKTIIT